MKKYIQGICKNCDPRFNRPGRTIKIDNVRDPHCSSCGKEIVDYPDYIKSESQKRWDKYFHDGCEWAASKSPCLSRNIGALLVRDNSIVATGYNGPPRGVPHCGHERWMKDKALNNHAKPATYNWDNCIDFHEKCPRKVLGHESGTHMELCPAQHAEQNCISNAARLGVEVRGTTLYMNSVIPCKNCFGTLINAGIVEIVVDKAEVYDKYTQFLIDNSIIVIRKFEI